jgi:Zn-dependent protease
MSTSVRFGRIFGIEIGAHWSVLVIGGLLVYGLTGGAGDGSLWLVAIATVVTFFGCLLAHELAHSVVARRNGMQVRGITLWLLGGVAQLGGTMPSAGAELRIAAAGPAMSIGLGAGFLALGVGVEALGGSALSVSAFVWLGVVNFILAAFNLIPAAPLDGGRILAAALWGWHKDRTRAEITATRVGQGAGIVLIGGGLLSMVLDLPFFTLWTAFLGWFVFNAATREQQYARTTGALGNRRVRDVMRPPPPAVPGWVTVAALADQLPVPAARILPVAQWEGGLAGIVTAEVLGRVSPELRDQVRVVDVALPLSAIATAAPDEPLVAVLDRAAQTMLPILAVLEHDQLVGLVLPEDLHRAAGGVDPAAVQV